MNNFIAQQLPILVLILSTTFIFCIVGAVFLADLKLSRLLAKPSKRPRAVRLAVIIHTENNEATLKRCLDSIRQTRQRLLEIIIIDNHSSDKTPHIIRTFQEENAHLTITTIFKKKIGERNSNILQAAKKIKNSEYVIIISGRVLAPKNSFNSVRSALVSNPTCNYVVFKSIAVIEEDLSNFTYILTLLSTYLLQKSTSLLNIKSERSAQDIIVQPVTDFKKKLKKPRNLLTSYAIEFRTLSERTEQMRTKKGLALKIALVVTVSYFCYIAVHFRAAELLVYSFLLFIIWFIFLLFSIPSLSLKERFNGLYMLPLAYPLLYLDSMFAVISTAVLATKNTIHHKRYSSAKRL